MRVRILILKSRTLTTITQRIERDVKNSGIMQQYSGTPGVKSNFRDYPGKSGRVGRSAIYIYRQTDRGRVELPRWGERVYIYIRVVRRALNLHPAMPSYQSCIMCTEAAVYRCVQCSPCVYYCHECFGEAHTTVNIFHTGEVWQVIITIRSLVNARGRQ